MSRDLSTVVRDAAQGGNVPALFLVRLDFESGAVRVNNSGMTLIWGGHTWYGVGELGSIDVVSEYADLQMTGVSMQLTGIDPDMLSRVLGEQYQGRAVEILFAPLDSNYVVLADPVTMFRGRMDTPVIVLGETATITLSAESPLTDWERPRVRRYTNEDQLSQYPNDRGLEFVPQMVEKTLVWGRTL